MSVALNIHYFKSRVNFKSISFVFSNLFFFWGGGRELYGANFSKFPAHAKDAENSFPVYDVVKIVEEANRFSVS